MDQSFNPRPGRFGTECVCVGIAGIGGANYLGGATPLTANATTTFYLAPPPGKCFFYSFGATVLTVPVDADGTIIATAKKYDASADALVTLSATINCETLVTKERTEVLASSAATDAQLLFDTGDTIVVEVVNNSAAIDTQPAQLSFTVQLLMLE